jgi:hypothetical protein
LHVNGWNWRTSSSRLKTPKVTCCPSYAGYRPKTNAVILLHIGSQSKGKPHMGEIGKGKKTKNLNVVDVLTVEEQI